jgi:hypothetical protein
MCRVCCVPWKVWCDVILLYFFSSSLAVSDDDDDDDDDDECILHSCSLFTLSLLVLSSQMTRLSSFHALCPLNAYNTHTPLSSPPPSFRLPSETHIPTHRAHRTQPNVSGAIGWCLALALGNGVLFIFILCDSYCVIHIVWIIWYHCVTAAYYIISCYIHLNANTYHLPPTPIPTTYTLTPALHVYP